ncbi:MAG: DegV family protein [Ruminococcaceae bacterium]|nr:DegV family protein [Oscillospiraceae bacterium]
MDKIKFIVDSTSDITLEIAEKYDITVLGQTVRFGDESYIETEELSSKDFWKKLKAYDGFPKTAQINITRMVDAFTEYSDRKIIFVALSSKASGTIQSATLAKNMVLEEHPDADITIFDSQSFSYGYGYWVREAARKAMEGETDVQKLISFMEEGIKKTSIYFVVDKLDYLQNGGRLSPAAKFIGNVLDIKPVLAIVDGLILNVAKVRGSKKVLPKLVDMMLEDGYDIENQTILVLHSDEKELAQKAKEKISEKVNVKGFEEVIIGGTVGANTGPGVIGIMCLKK